MKGIPASDNFLSQHHHIFKQTGDKNKENHSLQILGYCVAVWVNPLIFNSRVSFCLLFFCRFPVVAMGLLKWVDCTVCDPSFFKLLTDSTPVHLALLDEVCDAVKEQVWRRTCLMSPPFPPPPLWPLPLPPPPVPPPPLTHPLNFISLFILRRLVLVTHYSIVLCLMY